MHFHAMAVTDIVVLMKIFNMCAMSLIERSFVLITTPTGLCQAFFRPPDETGITHSSRS